MVKILFQTKKKHISTNHAWLFSNSIFRATVISFFPEINEKKLAFHGIPSSGECMIPYVLLGNRFPGSRNCFPILDQKHFDSDSNSDFAVGISCNINNLFKKMHEQY